MRFSFADLPPVLFCTMPLLRPLVLVGTFLTRIVKRTLVLFHLLCIELFVFDLVLFLVYS